MKAKEKEKTKLTDKAKNAIQELVNTLIIPASKVKKSDEIIENIENAYYNAKKFNYIAITTGSPFTETIMPKMQDLAMKYAMADCSDVSKLDYAQDLYDEMYDFAKESIRKTNQIHQNEDNFHNDVENKLMLGFEKPVKDKIWNIAFDFSSDNDRDKLNTIENLVELVELALRK